MSINEILEGSPGYSMTSSGKKIWQAVTWLCAYLIWKNRNQTVFSNKGRNGPVALSEIQQKSFEWIERRSKKKKLNWLGWLVDPKSFVT